MRDFLRRTFFVDRRKQLSAVTVERRQSKKVTGDLAAQRLDESIDRFSMSMKKLKAKMVEAT